MTLNKKAISFGFIISLVLCYSSLIVNQDAMILTGNSALTGEVSDRFQIAYEAHSPISIAGDENLTSKASLESWSGNGTLEDPFIIEEYNITLPGLSSMCIALYNISFYLVIRHCYVSGGSIGVHLENVTRFSSYDNIIHNNAVGMHLINCDHSIILATNFTENTQQLDVEDSYNINIEQCQFIAGDQAIAATNVAYSWIVNNTFSEMSDGIILDTGCIGNSIAQNTFLDGVFFGLQISGSSFDNSIIWNSFEKPPDSVYDNSNDIPNDFSYNYYSGFTSFDLDSDGVYDTPYHIPGTAGAYDYHPLKYQPYIPTWIQIPKNLEIELGDSCHNQFKVQSYPPISEWSVNDTLHFVIDQNGVLMDRRNLTVGEYNLEVTVINLYGQSLSGEFIITVVDTTAPRLITTPEETDITFGEDVYLQLIAWDLSGIAGWSLNDTGIFTLSWTSYGEMSVATIENSAVLKPGVYPLHLTVFDSSGLMRAADFNITVERASAKATPLIWILFPTGLAGAAILFGIIAFLNTRKPLKK